MMLTTECQGCKEMLLREDAVWRDEDPYHAVCLPRREESWGKPRRYLTDDRDHTGDPEPPHELVIFPAENGDWYVGVWPKGNRTGPAVRICTSGGAARACPDLPVAISRAYRAMEHKP